MNRAIKKFQHSRKSILDTWVDTLLPQSNLPEPVIGKEDLHTDSSEFLNSSDDNLFEENLMDSEHKSFDGLLEILNGVSMAHSKKEFIAVEIKTFRVKMEEHPIRIK
jgi:hypothetical protein